MNKPPRRTLRLAISPCPNDTFTFYHFPRLCQALTGSQIELSFHDIENLNQLALSQTPELIKVSAALLPRLAPRYRVLRCGAALGFGVGPLLLTRHPRQAQELQGAAILVPGEHTTAHALLKGWLGTDFTPVPTLFSEIMPRLAAGEAAAGLVIHESRFTYAQHGLHLVQDLGRWWEQEQALPLPLGLILARRDLGDSLISQLNQSLSQALQLSFATPWREQPELALFIRQHAQELSEEVLDAHIRTYVNAESQALSPAGIQAILHLAQLSSPDFSCPAAQLFSP